MVRMSLLKHADVAVNAGKSDKTSPLSCGCTKEEQLLLGAKKIGTKSLTKFIAFTIFSYNKREKYEKKKASIRI